MLTPQGFLGHGRVASNVMLLLFYTLHILLERDITNMTEGVLIYFVDIRVVTI